MPTSPTTTSKKKASASKASAGSSTSVKTRTGAESSAPTKASQAPDALESLDRSVKGKEAVDGSVDSVLTRARGLTYPDPNRRPAPVVNPPAFHVGPELNAKAVEVESTAVVQVGDVIQATINGTTYQFSPDQRFRLVKQFGRA